MSEEETSRKGEKRERNEAVVETRLGDGLVSK